MFLDILHSITETMPISSTAHLQLVSFVSGLALTKSHIIHLHLGTAIAGFLFVRKLALKLIIGLFKATEYSKAAYSCLLITLIQVCLSFPISIVLNKIDAKPLLQLSLMGFCSIVAGLFLYVALFISGKLFDYKPSLSLQHILPITFFQTFAFFPGVSRLGASLTAFKTLGFDTRISWQYSIALGIPLSIGASLLTFIKDTSSFDISLSTFVITTLVAYFLYFIAIRINLKAYAIYKVCFGIITLLLLNYY